MSEPSNNQESLKGAVRKWVDYTLSRAKQLEADARAAADNGYNQRRLRTKAGVFRSLAIEMERLVDDNVQVEARD